MPPTASYWDAAQNWIEAETGMDFSGDRSRRLRDALAKCLGANPEAELQHILSHSGRQAAFLERLTGELTVGESYFFRNEHHFRAMREHVLPRILRENAARREVRVWSAGCASGEEPYSLAILLDQLVGSTTGWRVSVLGTDLNPDFLHRADSGCYRQWAFRHTDIHNNRLYFSPQQDTFCLNERVKKHVRLQYLNLVKDDYPSPLSGTVGLDLILFRNVAIYLRPDVTAAIIDRFYRSLRPGGWLLLGETEVTGTPAGNFRVERFGEATFYHKAQAESAVGVPSDLGFDAVRPVLFEAAQPFANADAPAPPQWTPLPKRRQSPSITPPRSRDAVYHRDDSAQADPVLRAITQNNLPAAERELVRIADGRRRAKLRLSIVRWLLEKARTSEARQSLTLCLQEDPLLIEGQLIKAAFCEEDGDLRAAADACRRALYADPRAPMAHFQLALVLIRQGDRTGAARSLKTVLNLIDAANPQAVVRHGEGVCYGRLKEMVAMVQSH